MKFFLKHKDNSEQEVLIQSPFFTEEGGGKNLKQYKEPMVLVRVLGIPIEKPWSYKTVPAKYITQK